LTEINNVMSQWKCNNALIASLLLIIFFSPALTVHAQGWPKYDARGNLSESYSSQGLNFTLLSSKARYLAGEPIIIDCQIRNHGFYPVTIYFDNESIKNFTFIIRDQKGQSLPLKPNNQETRKKMVQNSSFYSDYTGTDYNARAIILQPDESITRSFKLQDLVNTGNLKSGVNNFNISAYFYPNPEQSNEYYIRSNNDYNILVDQENDSRNNSYYAENSLPFQELNVSPKEVVYLMLTAEYEKDWKTFFKYIDLFEVIRDYPDHARQYIRAPEDKKNMVIDDFKKFLMGSSRHKLIKFAVLGESLENRNARVTVKAMREIDGFDRDFVYTYYLSPMKNLWQVSGVESQLVK